MKTEHTMVLKSQMDYGHRPPYHLKNNFGESGGNTAHYGFEMDYGRSPPYHKDNIAILYLGNRESKHQAIKF